MSYSYSSEEKAEAQAANDVCVFGISSCIALLSGLVLSEFGWQAVLDGVLIIYFVGLSATLLTLKLRLDVRSTPPLSHELSAIH